MKSILSKCNHTEVSQGRVREGAVARDLPLEIWSTSGQSGYRKGTLEQILLFRFPVYHNLSNIVPEAASQTAWIRIGFVDLP